jgi:hypothetical protein
MIFKEQYGNNILIIELEETDTHKEKQIAISTFNLIKALVRRND